MSSRPIPKAAFISQRPQVLNVKSYKRRGTTATKSSKLSLLKDEVFEVGRTCMTDDDVAKHGEFCALNLFHLKIDDYRNGSCISALKKHEQDACSRRKIVIESDMQPVASLWRAWDQPSTTTSRNY
jgi:hypothetical protein